MKRIIVAGAGHGGLSAAINLSRNGFDVTVVEKNRLEDLGYDWHDTMLKKTFELAGIPSPAPELLFPMEKMCYYSRNQKIKIAPEQKISGNIAYIDRKILINHLIDCAMENGVRFLFESEILRAVCETNRVTGIRFVREGQTKELRGDLVIDAAGLNSPVRKSLPAHFGIEREIQAKDVFYAWRGYFEKTEEKQTSPAHSVFFYHCATPGMDWAITQKGYVDILIGGFGKLTQKNIADALADFQKQYPFMGKKLLRGGECDLIPLGKTLPVFVCNGYAAVGNSAFMTEPLSGSGIDLSIRAGKLLADTLLSSDGDTTGYGLWNYNREYIKKYAERYYTDLILKNFLSSLTADDIDFFFDRKILTAKELARGSKYTPGELLQKANILRRPALLPPLAGVGRKLLALRAVRAALPEEYDGGKIGKWKKAYGKL